MKVLLDECLPKKLKRHLLDFDVKTVTEMEWNSIKNGKLMKLAVENGFDLFLTIDKNLQHQQNLQANQLTVVVLDVKRSKIELLIPLLILFRENVAVYEKGKVYIISQID